MNTTTMNSTTHLKRMAIAEKIRKQLVAAHNVRDARRGHVRTPLGDEPGWVVYEREVVEAAVNAELAAAGHPPVDPVEILSAEAAAAGAEDFARKFSQNAADLVLERVQA